MKIVNLPYNFEQTIIKDEIAEFRKFKERKKLYATDPQNLYRLYEQEWKRIKNLATHRRRQAFQPRSNNNSTTQMSSKQLQSLRSSASHETSDRSSSSDNKRG